MKKLFTVQKIAFVLYIAVTLAAFVYAVAFMTQYSDLVGLKTTQNKLVANFYEVGLQTFNRWILAWALVAMAGIALSFALELRTRVPDRFALVVAALFLALCCYGAWFAIVNLQALSVYYQGLDFSHLALEGGPADYQPKLTTFYLGTGIYVAQMAVCVGFGAILAASHIKFKKLERGRA